MVFLVFIILTGSSILSSDAQREANYTKITPKLSSFEKISPIIREWSTSPQPESFAQENNLKYFDGKITVYLYLISEENKSQIPEGIEIVSNSDNIVVVNVDSRQITQLSQLDFVQRIDLPVSGSFSQQPTIRPPEEVLDGQISNDSPISDFDKSEQNESYYFIYGIITAALILAILLVLRRKFRVSIKH